MDIVPDIFEKELMIMLTVLGAIIVGFGALAAVVGAFRTGGLLIRAINKAFDWIGEKLG